MDERTFECPLIHFPKSITRPPSASVCRFPELITQQLVTERYNLLWLFVMATGTNASDTSILPRPDLCAHMYLRFVRITGRV